MSVEFIFAIDTNQPVYKNDFQDELIAYISGRLNQAGDGKREAEIFYEEMNLYNDEWEDMEEFVGCWEMFKNPFDFFIEKIDKQGKFQIGEKLSTPGWFATEQGNVYRENEIERAREEYKGKTVVKYVSYQSIGIFLNRLPNEEEQQILMERARKFIGYYKKILEIEIIGFRLLEITTETKTVQIWNDKNISVEPKNKEWLLKRIQPFPNETLLSVKLGDQKFPVIFATPVEDSFGTVQICLYCGEPLDMLKTIHKSNGLRASIKFYRNYIESTSMLDAKEKILKIIGTQNGNTI